MVIRKEKDFQKNFNFCMFVVSAKCFRSLEQIQTLLRKKDNSRVFEMSGRPELDKKNNRRLTVISAS